jgi:hypothetical protein
MKKEDFPFEYGGADSEFETKLKSVFMEEMNKQNQINDD